MSKMKLIMENWKGFVNEQQDPIQTIGQLKQALKRIKAAKARKQTIDTAKDIAAGAILDAIPGAATVKNLFDLVKPFYSLPDEKRTNTSLDNLDVDDDVSKIVADEIERAFLLDLSKMLEGMSDDTRLKDINMTRRLSSFISDKFNQRTVVVPSK